MARRRRRTVRRASSPRRRASFRAAPRRRKSSGSNKVNLRDLGTTAIGGAARGYVGQLAAPLQRMIPAGALANYADNIAIAGVAYGAGRFLPGTKKYATKILHGEAYLAGIKAGARFTTPAANSSTGSTTPVYG